LILAAATPSVAPAADTPYLVVVRRCADTLLDKGVDHWGPRKTALIASVLDRTTLMPPSTMPKSPGGNRQGDRCVPYGSNANLQQNLYVTFFHLSRITGDPRYGTAATAAMVDLFRVTQNPETGLLAWGEHLCWDLKKGQAATQAAGWMIHEPKRKLLFFDMLYEREPKRVLDFAEGLWENQIADHKTGNFSRHAGYEHHITRRDYDFAKEGSYFIDCWSRAYEKTHKPLFQEAVRVLAGRYLHKLNEHNLMDFDSTGLKGRADVAFSSDMLSLAIEAQDAVPRMDGPTAATLNDLVARIDRGILALPHAPDDPERGFVCYAQTSTGKLGSYRDRPGWSRSWDMGYGIKPTSMIALFCNRRQAQLKIGPQAEAYRSLVLKAAEGYRKSDPSPKTSDLWPSEYGMAIFTELAAFRLVPTPAYLDRAKALADQAIEIFFDQGNPLPRASTKSKHYENITCADTLLLALLALHEQVSGQAVEIAISDLDR
jgi:hypothetical protein